MANPTTYFGWVMPNSADLVTDLPADFAVFGQGVDTSMQYLLGGTTGQVLSKTSGTNMAFTWINNDQGDITGVTAGTGITVTSPTGPVPTVAIDTTVTVDKTTAQTLTNKTLTSPALTTPTISTATTNGDILYGTGSGALARLGIGTTGQVLNVASGIPAWTTASSGSFTKIQTTSFSAVANTSTSFDGVFTSTYKNYVLVFSNMYSSGSQQLLFQFRVSGVTRSAGYYGSYSTIPYNASITTTGSNNVGSCQIFNLQNSTGPAGMTLNVRTMGGSSQEGQIYGIGYDVTVLGPLFTGYENTTAAVNTGFILSVASGTVTGTVTVYGLEN